MIRLLAIVAVLLQTSTQGVQPLPSIAAGSLPSPELRVTTTEDDGNDLLVLLDTSGSMRDSDAKGTIKIEGAKTGIISLINTLPSSVRVGIHTFPRDTDCGEPKIIYELGAIDPASLAATVARLPNPDGNTPTALALTSAAKYLEQRGKKTATIVLVSDGQSNCNIDPCEAAKQLVKEGYRITVNTVGFDIGNEGRKELQCIAEATSGKYYDAADSGELGKAIEEASRPRLTVMADYPQSAIPISTRTVKVQANIKLDAGISANNVQASLVPAPGSSGQFLAVRGPVRLLGNLTNDRPTSKTNWIVTPHRTSANSTAVMDLSVRAAGIPVITQRITLKFSNEGAGTITQDSAFSGIDSAVVLGDSFSSGEGAADDNRPYLSQGANECHRTQNQYANWIFKPDQVKILACSGAQSKHVVSDGQHGEPSQLAQLGTLLDGGYRPGIVFVSIGGNDARFGEIVKMCVISNIADQLSKVALSSYVGRVIRISREAIKLLTGKDVLNLCPISQESLSYPRQMELVKAVAGNLPTTYQAIRKTFTQRGLPSPPIVVVPYPVLVPMNAQTRGLCMPAKNVAQNLALSLKQFDDFLAFQLTFDKLISDAVDRARKDGEPVYYAQDVSWALQPDHSICSARPWVNPITIKRSVSELVHPNMPGHQSMGIELLRWSQRPEAKQVGGSSTFSTDHRSAPHTSPLESRVTGQQIQVGENSQPQQLRFGQASVTASGFAPYSQVGFYARSAPVFLGTAFADADGVATVSFEVDHRRFAPGRHAINAIGSGNDGSPRFLQVPVELGPQLSWLFWSLFGFATLLTIGGLTMLLLRRRMRPNG